MAIIDVTIGAAESPNTDKAKALEVLDKAKALHDHKAYELRVDGRTTIMVSKENFNRGYAEAYRARLVQRNLVGLKFND